MSPVICYSSSPCWILAPSFFCSQRSCIKTLLYCKSIVDSPAKLNFTDQRVIGKRKNLHEGEGVIAKVLVADFVAHI